MTTPAAVPAPEAAPPATPPLMVPIGDIVPSPLNPRTHFDIAELIDSVRTHGVLMPLLTRPRKGQHEIVEGERRYRAAKAAGVLFLEVKSRELSDADALEIMLLANGQREDLTPLEEARGYRRLITTNKAKYSVAYIADRISRSEKYVADRMRLLKLVPALQQLLEQERIPVGHAELLATLKPEDQARAIDPDRGGLWQATGATLDFGGEADDAAEPADPYAGYKPRTLKELEAWIARHVRFDLAHAATTAPLDFGPTAAAVALAEAKDGRGRKWISITRDYSVHPDAKDPDGGRIYGERSWKRADGSPGTSRDGRGRSVDSPVCDYAITGVFVAGPGYGTALPVCIARDKCTVHWKAEIAAKKKHDQLRARGQGATAAAKERKAAETREAQAAREREARIAFNAKYRRLYPLAVDVIRKAFPTTLAEAFPHLWARLGQGRATPILTTDAERLDALLLTDLSRTEPVRKDDTYTSYDWEWRNLQAIAKRYGASLKPVERAVDEAIKAETTAAKSTTVPSASAKAPARKQAKTKAATKR